MRFLSTISRIGEINGSPPGEHCVRQTNNDPAHCFAAIELSKSSWVLGFQTPLAKQTSRYQVKACDAKALLELIEQVRSRMARELGRPVEVMSCYEAGYDGFWLHLYDYFVKLPAFDRVGAVEGSGVEKAAEWGCPLSRRSFGGVAPELDGLRRKRMVSFRF